MDQHDAARPYRGRGARSYGGDDIRRDFHTVDGKWPRGEIARWLRDTARCHYGDRR